MPTVLVSLDLRAAFEMIDHHTLITRLSSSFGTTGTPLSFLTSYLSNRTQCVRSGNCILILPIVIPESLRVLY